MSKYRNFWNTKRSLNDICSQATTYGGGGQTPTATTCLMAKIAEKWLLHLLLPYVDPKLSDTQFGFRQGRSTEDALAYFEKLVCDGFEKCKNATKVCTIFFDVKAVPFEVKAFDTVPLSRLLTCLENHYKVPSYLLSVLKSFVTNRTQCVRVGTSLSGVRNVLSGTPQGGVLSPEQNKFCIDYRFVSIWQTDWFC